MRARVALVVAVLGLMLLALLVEFRRLIHRPPRSEPAPAPIAVDDQEESVAASAPVTSPPSRYHSVARAAPRAPRAGVAHLRGRVMRAQPADGEPSFSDLEVTADKGDRTFEARGGPEEDRFELHVPPGRYTLTARAEGLIAVARDLILVAGSEREVLLRLEPAVTITGELLGSPDDEHLFLLAVRTGSHVHQGDGTIEGTAFTFGGLLAGETYDLEIGGRSVRTTTLRGITAPAEDLRVRLERLPMVRGAVGFARGSHCPFRTVKLIAAGPLPPPADPAARARDDDHADDDDPASAPLEADCRFELPVPAAATAVTVAATGPGWHAEEQVAIPPVGDPEPVCLNPPCRSDPLEGLAELVVSMAAPEGAEGREGADGVPRIEASAGNSACNSQGVRCELRNLPVGEPILVSARRTSCATATREVVLTSGANVLDLACASEAPPAARERQVLGVVRALAGNLPARLSFRCAGGGAQERDLRRTPIFLVPCPRDAGALEYQLSTGAPWTSVAIPPAQDPALVEIQVGPL